MSKRFRSTPIVTSVVDTTHGEKRWSVYYRCPKHRLGQVKTCKPCSARHSILARIANYYIKRQVQEGFAAPGYQVEATFIQVINKSGRDNRFIWALTKFKGFKKPEWVQTNKPNPFLSQKKKLI